MPDPRDAVVGGVLGDVADALARSKGLYAPTEHEERIINGLIVQALGLPMVDALELTHRQFQTIVTKGRAAKAVINEFVSWPSCPDKPLSDLLKVADPERIDRVHGKLRRLSGS